MSFPSLSAGRDYIEHSATLEFAMSDEVTKCTDILLIDDSILEDQDDFSVYMNATNPADDAVKIAPGSMVSTITILDNDIVTVGVQNESYTVDESDGQLPVCVTLTGEIERAVQVTFHTEAGTALGNIGSAAPLLHGRWSSYSSLTINVSSDQQVKNRTSIPSLKTFSLSLVPSMSHGAPISHSWMTMPLRQ